MESHDPLCLEKILIAHRKRVKSQLFFLKNLNNGFKNETIKKTVFLFEDDMEGES